MFSTNKTFQQYLKKESTGHFSFCIVKSQLSENNHIFSFTGTIVLDYHESEDSKYWCFTVLFSLP